MSRPQREGHPRPAGQGWWRGLLGRLGLAGPAPCQRELSPDEDLQIAFQASSDGDLEHAAYHVACVLKHNPTDRRATSLLDRLIAKKRDAGQDPLDLAPLGTGREGTYAGVVGARAHILAQQEQWADAVDLVRQLAHGDPQTPWWKWGVDWLARPGVAEQANTDVQTGLLAHVAYASPGDIVRDPEARAALDAARPAAEASVHAHPRHELLRVLHITIVRKLGHTDEACRLADTLWRDSPSRMTGVARGMARKASGDLPAAIRAFEEAVPLDDTDASVPADLAEFNCALGRFDDALRWADETKKRDPSRETSSWVLWYHLKDRLDPSGNWMQQLGEYLAKHPDARQPGADAMARIGPWDGYVPAAQEATIDVVSQVLAQVKAPQSAGHSVTLRLSALESPSSRLAADGAMTALNLRLELAVEAVASPDPRQSDGDVRWLTWRYDGTDPRPALPEPPAAVRDAIAALARERYDRATWWSAARSLARSIVDTGLTPAQAAEPLLATMAHPPARPDGWTDWAWWRVVQTAAAFAVAHVDSGWQGSARRDALVSLIRGPVD